jgi:hypothetical protein
VTTLVTTGKRNKQVAFELGPSPRDARSGNSDPKSRVNPDRFHLKAAR